MNIYTSIIVRQYAEGRICLTTDRIGSYLTNEGGSSALWRHLLEWVGQKYTHETITVGVINNCNVPYRSKLEQLIPISFEDIVLSDVIYKDLSDYDMLYFIGLPQTSSSNLETVLEEYVRGGGGLYIEVPDKDGVIDILKGIESINCESINRPQFGISYWTPTGKLHYSYTPSVYVGFLTSLRVSDFSSDWVPLMTNVPSDDATEPEVVIETLNSIGSEFGVGFTIAMQNGLVEIDLDMSTSSSSSIDSTSSSSTSSGQEDTAWDFCDNIIAYWKMDENVDSPVVWEQSKNLSHMGVLMSGSTPIYTSSRHVSGIVDGALSFNGTTHRIVTGSNFTLNFSGTTSDSPFTISFWIYPTNQTGQIFWKDQVWEVSLASSVLYMSMYSASGYRTYYMSGAAIELNKWSNITITSDGTLSGMSMYLNGALKNNTGLESTYDTMLGADTPMYIGALYSTNHFSGYMGNVFILNKKVSVIEAEALWNLGRGNTECSGIYRYSSSSSSSSESSDSSFSSSSSSIDSSSSSSSNSSSSSS